MENRYRGQWIVPLSHCDETGRLSVQGALGEFMDIAALHAEQIGVGGADMAKRGLFWLTVRTRIRFYKRPAMMQTVELETWPGTVEGMRCERYYTMKRGDALLAEAKSAAERARAQALQSAHQEAAQATRAMRARVRDEETAAAAAVDAKLPELVTALTGGLLGSDAAERNAAQIRQWVAPAHEG